MTTREQELGSLREEFESREAGVAELMEFYEKVEKIYLRAALSVSQSDAVYTSDSTNMVRPNAYLGRNSKGTP